MKMKVLRIIFAVILSVFMLGYMIMASALFAIDLSFDERYIQQTLGSSDSLAKLVRSAEIAINEQLEENAEDIVENMGGNAAELNLEEIYKMPEATALFADVLTGTARYIFYGEEYSQVNGELVEDYLCAVANFGSGREVSDEEMEDYLSVGLEAYTESFNRAVSAMLGTISQEPELLSSIRFIFNDLKFVSIAATIIHMLMLILLIRGKTGYFANAAVFGMGGLSVLGLGAGLEGALGSIIPNAYAGILAEILYGRFQLIGAILFAVFAVLMLISLLLFIRREKLAQEQGQ